jgi:hypothetical protein
MYHTPAAETSSRQKDTYYKNQKEKRQVLGAHHGNSLKDSR